MAASAENGDMAEVAAIDKVAAGDVTADGTPQPDNTKSDDDPKSPTPPPAAAPKVRMCGICEKEEGKYKCSRCYVPYCSVACNKKHLENHPPDPPRPPKPAPETNPREAMEKKRKAHPFSVLEDSPQLRMLFKKYPGLPARLERIHSATLPPNNNNISPPRGGLPRNLQQTAAFRKPQNWTHDTGLKRGKEALRKARTDPGEEGEGVREYCELVLHLLSRSEQSNITDMVRKEVTAEDVRLIEQLMEVEGRIG